MTKQFKQIGLASLLFYSVGVSASWFVEEQPQQVNNVYPVTQQTMKTMTWLGVSLSTLPEALRQQIKDKLQTFKGALVQAIQPGSPAEKAELKAFDVIVSFSGKGVNSPEQLNTLIFNTLPNKTVNVVIIRQGQIKTLKVKLGKRSVTPPKKQVLMSQSHGFQPQALNQGFWDRGLIPFVGKNGLGNNLGGYFPNTPGLSIFNHHTNQFMFRQRKDGMIQVKGVIKDNRGIRRNVFYQGNQQSIYDQILNQPNVPMKEKKKLLTALDSHLNKKNGWMGGFPIMNNGSMFNPQTWWK